MRIEDHSRHLRCPGMTSILPIRLWLSCRQSCAITVSLQSMGHEPAERRGYAA